MKILFAASEMAPFAKTGGLGDVVGSLPIALRKQGIDARVVIPHYSSVGQVEYKWNFSIPRHQGGRGEISVHYTEYQGVPVYFLRSWPYFIDDGKIYTVWDWDTPRFIYFAQMVLGLIWELANGADKGEKWWADVLHVHDWHTGLAPFLLHEARFNPGWNEIASVLTIHNMAFQGPYAGGWLFEEGIPNRDTPILYRQALRDNLLGIGIAYANKINTVSPRHATELHYPRFGEGLQDLVWARDADFTGILNGIDTNVFNPETDPLLAKHFNAENFRTHRAANKSALAEQHNLDPNPDRPLIAVISRLTEQKGFDFTIPALRHVLANSNAQFIGIGTGDPALEAAFGQIGWDFSSKARTYITHDNNLARQIYAAADILLVPSRYEPCGLAQIIAMRYGCIPLARETGGLADTVWNYDGSDNPTGTGFTFLFEEMGAVIGTLNWALETFHTRKEVWQKLQYNGMTRDWSWDTHLPAYMDLYQGAIEQKRWWKNT